MVSTIKDIARKTGVACSTVSRVLNGKGSISDETKNKIYQAAKELDYHPNSVARSFVKGSTSTLGLIFNAQNEKMFSNSFFNRSLYAIERVAQENNYNLLISNFTDMENFEAFISSKKIDGIIVPSSVFDREICTVLSDLQFPFTVLGQVSGRVGKCSWIDIDNSEGSRMAVEHLNEQGYFRPIFVCNNRRTTFDKNRIFGFLDAVLLENHDNNNLIVECNNVFGEKFKERIYYCLESNSADSIICSNNVIASNVLKCLKEGNYSVPEDCGVITFDNYPLAEYLDPTLTAVDVDTYLIGEQAASILIHKISKQHTVDQHILITPSIFKRKSTLRR